MKPFKNTLIETYLKITQDYSVYAVVLGLILLFTTNDYSLLGAVLLFSGFDYIGFQRITKTDSEMKGLIEYRILQTLLQYSLLYHLYTLDIFYALEFLLLWWFGVCDILYYILGKENPNTYGKIYWIWWTPLGIISTYITKKSLFYKEMLIQGLVGTIIVLLINYRKYLHF